MPRLLSLKCGRKLEVEEYGDLSGHPAFFFHGLIGSHHQASFIREQARLAGLRVIAANRPGVGRSEFVRRDSAVEGVADVEELADALAVDRFSVIGISGGAPYALAVLLRLTSRVSTTTIISGMGPTGMPGALRGMDRRRRLFLELGTRMPRAARAAFRGVARRYRADPERFLEHLVRTWSEPDRALFRDRVVFETFLRDLDEVLRVGAGGEGLAAELGVYRNPGFSLSELPADRTVTVWHGLSDTIVPPAMAWAMTEALPSMEAHFLPGGHFVAVNIAGRVIDRLRFRLAEGGASGR